MIKCDKSKPLHNLCCAWRSASFTAGNNTRPHFFIARYCVSPSTVVCTGIKNPMKQTISSPASRNGRRGKQKKHSLFCFHVLSSGYFLEDNIKSVPNDHRSYDSWYNLLPSNFFLATKGIAWTFYLSHCPFPSTFCVAHFLHFQNMEWYSACFWKSRWNPHILNNMEEIAGLHDYSSNLPSTRWTYLHCGRLHWPDLKSRHTGRVSSNWND